LSSQRMQISSEDHSASNSISTIKLLQECEVVGHDADHSAPSTAEVKKEQPFCCMPCGMHRNYQAVHKLPTLYIKLANTVQLKY
jgi:hypothetical protein